MKTIRLLALSLLLIGGASAGAEPLLDDRVVILGGGPPRTMCSRSPPAGIEGTWRPSSDDIQRIESDLAMYLASGPECAPGDALTSYYRQYSGFRRRGRRYIYLNAFYARAFDARAPQSADRWRSGVLDVCDGGDGFWGVEYDVETRSFWNLRFNYAFEMSIAHCYVGDQPPWAESADSSRPELTHGAGHRRR